MTGAKSCQKCGERANWRWWNGMGAFGPYCGGHAREQLDGPDSYKTPIQRPEDCSEGHVVPAGIIPLDATLPCIRTTEAFDIYLDTGGDVVFERKPRPSGRGGCQIRRSDSGVVGGGMTAIHSRVELEAWVAGVNEEIQTKRDRIAANTEAFERRER